MKIFSLFVSVINNCIEADEDNAFGLRMEMTDKDKEAIRRSIRNP